MRHGWRPLNKYLAVHDRIIRFNQKYMDVPRGYKETWLTPNYLHLSCKNLVLTTFNGNKVRVDIRIDVEVDDSVPNRPKARTFGYTFSANQPGESSFLIRYDSPHTEDESKETASHHKHHHKHEFTSEGERIQILDEEDRPHVGEFLSEVLRRF